MKTYLEFNNEIVSYQDVLNTVEAIEQIAASSIHRLKVMASALESYTQALLQTMDRLTELGAKDTSGYLVRPQQGQRVLCIMGGEKGIVGGLYQGLINEALLQRQKYDQMVAVGSKIASLLTEEGLKPVRAFPSYTEYLTTEEIKPISDFLLSNFGTAFQQVDLLYPVFTSEGKSQAVLAPFLPFTSPLQPVAADSPWYESINPPIHEPDTATILNWLLGRYIESAFKRFAAESKLSELTARTVTSEKASHKTKELIDSLHLAFFRERERWLDQMQLQSFSANLSL